MNPFVSHKVNIFKVKITARLGTHDGTNNLYIYVTFTVCEPFVENMNKM